MPEDTTEKKKPNLFEFERKQLCMRGITVGRAYTFFIRGGEIVTGQIIEAKDGWVFLDNGTKINMCSEDLVMVKANEACAGDKTKRG